MARNSLIFGDAGGPPSRAKTSVSSTHHIPIGGRERATCMPLGGLSGQVMADDHSEGCDFCRRGRVIKRNEDIGFYQWTDKGYLYCRATVPIGVCEHCGMKSWDDASESIIEDAVRRAYDRR
ncbi:MAG: hypothetical protein ACJ8FK_18215 [Xanthobacteraceae bacterium]